MVVCVCAAINKLLINIISVPKIKIKKLNISDFEFIETQIFRNSKSKIWRTSKISNFVTLKSVTCDKTRY